MNDKDNTSKTKIILEKEKDFEYFFQKKINFNSAFDHRGSKQFLHSKKEALKQIIIDDPNSSSNDDNNDTLSQSNHQKKHFKYSNYKGSNIKKLKKNKAKSTNNIFYLSSVDNLKNKTLSKEKSHIKDDNNKRNFRRTLEINKKPSKFFSSQELKMLEDKEIKKIKPIKTKNNNIDNNNIFPFIESDKSLDSSLFKIVSHLQ